MWRDVFLNNKDAVLEMLGRFNEDLAQLQRAIRWGDGAMLEAFFTRTRAIRRGIIAAGQDTAGTQLYKSRTGAEPPKES
jgi:cyclohexadieny/prephenate dehydrogenase